VHVGRDALVLRLRNARRREVAEQANGHHVACVGARLGDPQHHVYEALVPVTARAAVKLQAKAATETHNNNRHTGAEVASANEQLESATHYAGCQRGARVDSSAVPTEEHTERAHGTHRLKNAWFSATFMSGQEMSLNLRLMRVTGRATVMNAKT